MTPTLAYFGGVFGTGFLLGTIRTLFLVPRLGVRNAELLELPLMVAAIFLISRWLLRRFPGARQPARARSIGLGALVLLLAAEVALGLVLRGGSVWDVLFDRDPISGAAYYVSLGIFALMPWWLARRAAASSPERL